MELRESFVGDGVRVRVIVGGDGGLEGQKSSFGIEDFRGAGIRSCLS